MGRIDYTCPDGIVRTLDSGSEIEFIEYCVKTGIKILEYNTDKHKKFELCEKPPLGMRSRKLETLLLRKKFIYDIEKMRNMEHIMKSYDFHVEIEGVEFLVEVKGEFTNKDEMNMNERQFYTTWAMTKTLMATKYGMPLLVFISKQKRGGYREWRCEYYLPETFNEQF